MIGKRIVLPKTAADLLNPERQADMARALQVLNAYRNLRVVISSGGQYSSSVIQFSGGAAVVQASALLSIPIPCRIFMVGGGGGGGFTHGGGGGAGGLIDETSGILYSRTVYQAVVGTGGIGAVGTGTVVSSPATNGNSSTLAGMIAYGGGLGGSYQDNPGGSGGSGGGGQRLGQPGKGVSGQGHNGGPTTGGNEGAGGGGAAVAGASGTGTASGGNGSQSNITGVSVYYAGGGGGSGNNVGSAGGLGGGGGGGSSSAGQDGTVNTGGGGGGGAFAGATGYAGGAGGSGIIIVRYAGSQRFSGGTITSLNGDTIHTFLSSGTLTPS